MNKECGGCRFYDEERGRCHRFPPQSEHGLIDNWWTFPYVRPSDWCGEWQKKQEKKDEVHEPA